MCTKIERKLFWYAIYSIKLADLCQETLVPRHVIRDETIFGQNSPTNLKFDRKFEIEDEEWKRKKHAFYPYMRFPSFSRKWKPNPCWLQICKNFYYLFNIFEVLTVRVNPYKNMQKKRCFEKKTEVFVTLKWLIEI